MCKEMDCFAHALQVLEHCLAFASVVAKVFLYIHSGCK